MILQPTGYDYRSIAARITLHILPVPRRPDERQDKSSIRMARMLR